MHICPSERMVGALKRVERVIVRFLGHLVACNICTVTKKGHLGAQTNNSAMFAEVLLSLHLCHDCIHAWHGLALC